jgi:hypothetical protein
MKLTTTLLALILCSLHSKAVAQEILTLPKLPKLLSADAFEKKIVPGTIITKENQSAWNLPFSFYVDCGISNGIVVSVSVQSFTVTPTNKLKSIKSVILIVGNEPFWTPEVSSLLYNVPEVYVPLSIEKTDIWRIESFHMAPSTARKAYVQITCEDAKYAIELNGWIKHDNPRPKPSTNDNINIEIKL